MSDIPSSTTGVLDALRAVQAAVPPLPKDKKNPHFKSSYTSLDTIVEKVGPLLNENGLVWTTMPSGTHEQPTLAYQLAHADTGEVINGSMPLLLDKSNAQGLGSALTYARRYALCAVLNLVADEDDDGTRAAARAAAPATPKIIDESEKAQFVEALFELTGAPDKSSLAGLWNYIRGQNDRPTVEVAKAVLAVHAQRAAFDENHVAPGLEAPPPDDDATVAAVQQAFNAPEGATSA